MLEHTRRLVESFDPGADRRAAEARRQILALLSKGAAAFRRDHYVPGHITASAITLSPHGVLLVFHKRLQRWLQPGGHIDPGDGDTVAAAQREVREEAGVEVANGVTLVGLDVHQIPAARGEPDHLHHDLVFLFDARTTKLTISDESSDVRWCPVNALKELKPDAALTSAVERAVSVGRKAS